MSVSYSLAKTYINHLSCGLMLLRIGRVPLVADTASDVVLETKVLVSRRLEDKNISLGLETQSLGLGLGLEIKVLVLVLVLTKKS